MVDSDFLVIGGGIAGLSYALHVAEYGSVIVLCKREPMLSSTSWAQGGIASVEDPKDSFDAHVQDTLIAGAGICNRSVVDIVVREAPKSVKGLIAWGAVFDRNVADNAFDLHQEGGHSARRIFHSADSTGREIQRALLARVQSHPNIAIVADSCAVDLITTRKLGIEKSKPNKALGAYVLNSHEFVEVYRAGSVMVATGGSGKIYQFTTNPDIATGDGVAMCFRAGCSVGNMEFFQFHPTTLFHPKEKTFLITEAMRGEGAILRRMNGDPFMSGYDTRKELAPRDIVARAIDSEMKKHGEEHVLLDITHRGAPFIRDHFPMIYEKCLSLGIDITQQPIPVVPAAHYQCGGVVCDEFGRTSISDLYVAGECACTGLHGANRLASNSLVEGLVFSARAAEATLKERDTARVRYELPAWDSGRARDSDEDVVITQTWGEIRRLMWNYVGIVRSNKRLSRALNRIKLIKREIVEYYWNFKLSRDLLELRNLSLVSDLVINSAIMRRESRGLHYNIDYPSLDDEFLKDTVVRSEEFFHYRKS